MDALISLKESRGNCARNLLISMDLARSGRALTNSYDRLNMSLCYNSKSNVAKLEIKAFANHSRTYSRDMIQEEVLKILQLQLDPIILAISQSLRDAGSSLR
jgi:hypothetical protein